MLFPSLPASVAVQVFKVLKPVEMVVVVPRVGEAVPVGDELPLFESFVGERERVREMLFFSCEREERVRTRKPRVGELVPSFLDPLEDEDLDIIEVVRGRELSAVPGGDDDPDNDTLEEDGFCLVGDRSSGVAPIAGLFSSNTALS